jgi:hypothetical protein
MHLRLILNPMFVLHHFFFQWVHVGSWLVERMGFLRIGRLFTKRIENVHQPDSVDEIALIFHDESTNSTSRSETLVFIFLLHHRDLPGGLRVAPNPNFPFSKP